LKLYHLNRRCHQYADYFVYLRLHSWQTAILRHSIVSAADDDNDDADDCYVDACDHLYHHRHHHHQRQHYYSHNMIRLFAASSDVIDVIFDLHSSLSTRDRDERGEGTVDSLSHTCLALELEEEEEEEALRSRIDSK
jgi:hypothetical protein